MAVAPTIHVEDSSGEARSSSRLRLFLLLPAAILICATAALALLGWRSYGRAKFIRDLGRNLASTVTVGSFRQVYFPHPGYIAENIVLTHIATGDTRPWLTVRRVTVRGSYFGMLTSPTRVSSLVAEQLFLRINAAPSRKGKQIGAEGGGWKSTVIDHFLADGAVLEIETDPAKPPLRFILQHLSLRSMGGNGPLTFHAALSNPIPPAQLQLSGQFGPLQLGNPGSTHLTGSYSLRHADMGVFPGIAGQLSSDGRFDGPLNRLAVSGEALVPNFEVKSAHHPLPLKAGFQTVVNGATGDVVLKSVIAQLARTRLESHGVVADSPAGSGKLTTLSISSPEGRIDDLLRLLLSSAVPPATGPIQFHTQVTLPPGPQGFLTRVQLEGAFGMEHAQPTRPSTKAEVDLLSERALGNKNTDLDSVQSDLRGQVKLQSGVATFSSLSFAVPGAHARLQGSYSLLNSQVDLRGNLRMQATVSQATTGFKSILLKIATPFYKRKHAGAQIPVSIEGTYAHPVFTAGPKAKR
ncbi:AsmA-like C-terminal region-containing protein [Acidipila rosea]|uniref:AsmA-like protein n=1 Tax=Acidipila rosea TaxID=768535 RepID=A0A4R1L0X9_9BACT|nr:AsmA-like C-terminal region-containing protein [Acidipila rosea]TCK71578.1 AsmA-like protein [Acidipila rosea]